MRNLSSTMKFTLIATLCLSAVAYFFLIIPSGSTSLISEEENNQTSTITSEGDTTNKSETSENLNKDKAASDGDISSDASTITNNPLPNIEVIKAKKITDIKHDDAANSIVSAVLDTLSGEVANVSLEEGTITTSIKWTSNIQTLNDAITNTFDYKRNTSIRNDEYPNVLISIAMPSMEGGDLETFKALTESKISLIIRAGKYEEKITIAAAQKDKIGKVKYFVLASKDAFHKELFAEGETMPITINDIPNDEIKLIKDVTLSIALERLDTGRTFRTTLDKKGI